MSTAWHPCTHVWTTQNVLCSQSLLEREADIIQGQRRTFFTLLYFSFGYINYGYRFDTTGTANERFAYERKAYQLHE